MGILTNIGASMVEHWLYVGAIAVVIGIILSILKKLISAIVVIAVAIILTLLALNYSPDDIREMGITTATSVGSMAQEQAIEQITKNSKDMKYEEKENGDFLITGKSVTFTGSLEDKTGKIETDKGSINIKLSDALVQFVEQMKKNSERA